MIDFINGILKDRRATFFIGLVMLIGGLYLFIQNVYISSGKYATGIHIGPFVIRSGVFVLPLLAALIWMFFRPRSKAAKVFAVIGLAIIVVYTVLTVNIRVSKEYGREPRHVRDQQQGGRKHDHERCCFLGQGHWLFFRKIGRHEQVESEGRSRKSDGKAAYKDDAEVDRVYSKLLNGRKKYRCKDDDTGACIHYHAEQQEQDNTDRKD